MCSVAVNFSKFCNCDFRRCSARRRISSALQAASCASGYSRLSISRGAQGRSLAGNNSTLGVAGGGRVPSLGEPPPSGGGGDEGEKGGVFSSPGDRAPRDRFATFVARALAGFIFSSLCSM